MENSFTKPLAGGIIATANESSLGGMKRKEDAMRFKSLVLGSLFAAGLALSVSQATAQQTLWIAVATNNYGWGYGEGNTESEARRVAIVRCEQQTGRTCSGMTASVPAAWPLVVVQCGSLTSVGGSQHSYPIAEQIAAGKIGYHPSQCRTLVSR